MSAQFCYCRQEIRNLTYKTVSYPSCRLLLLTFCPPVCLSVRPSARRSMNTFASMYITDNGGLAFPPARLFSFFLLLSSCNTQFDGPSPTNIFPFRQVVIIFSVLPYIIPFCPSKRQSPFNLTIVVHLLVYPSARISYSSLTVGWVELIGGQGQHNK